MILCSSQEESELRRKHLENCEQLKCVNDCLKGTGGSRRSLGVEEEGEFGLWTFDRKLEDGHERREKS